MFGRALNASRFGHEDTVSGLGAGTPDRRAKNPNEPVRQRANDHPDRRSADHRRHCLLSYVFGAAILATTINLITG
jgi:hypothetical protein